MIPFLLLLIGAAFLITLAAVPLVIRLAHRTHFYDLPGGHKSHDRPVPYGGGLAVAAGVMIPIAAGLAAAAWGGTALPAPIARHAAGVMVKLPQVLMLLGGASVMLLLGLMDDRRPIGPAVKLAVEALVALGIAVGSERLSLFAEGLPWVEIPVTALWIVGVTNAFNLMDHMDGVCPGLAMAAAAALGMVAVQTGQWFLAATLAPVAGASAAFLIYNVAPARIFLGDAGSLFLGFVLSVLCIHFTFYEPPYAIYVYAVPLVVMAVPLFDVTRVVAIRLRGRRPVFSPDRSHFAHRLTTMGLSPRAAWLVLMGLVTLCGISAVLLYQVDTAGAVLIGLELAVVMGIITVMERR